MKLSACFQRGNQTPKIELALDAFRTIHDSHFLPVKRFLLRRGFDETDALDLAQKVFMTAFLRRDQLRDPALLTPWLFGIGRRVAKDVRRRGRFRLESISDEFDLNSYRAYAASAPDPEILAEIAEHARIAERLLKNLAPLQRDVFTLTAVEGLTADELAARLGVSLGKVRSQLRRARQAMQREVRRWRLQSEALGFRELGASNR